MFTKCDACGNKIKTTKFLMCATCSKTYDLDCVNVSESKFTKSSQKFKETWSCPSCVCSKPKGDNTHTPVRNLSTHTNETSANSGDHVNTEPRGGSGSRTADDARSDTELSVVLTEIKNLRFEMLKQNQVLTTKLDCLTASFDQQINEYNKRLQDKDIEIRSLKESVAQLESRMESQEQLSMRSDIELVGIPEFVNENLYHIALVAAKKVGVDLTQSELDEVTRLGPRRRPTPTSENGNENPRTIIVKFTSRAKKVEFISASRGRRNLTTEGIVSGPSNRLYINERLTKNNRLLFREARILCKQHGFRYCWVRDGAIYVRREDRKPSFRIRCTDDLHLRVGPPEEQILNTTTNINVN